MSLLTLEFIAFFFVVLLLYYIVPSKFQWCCLLISSIFFIILVTSAYTLIYVSFSVASVYFSARYFEKTTEISKRRFVLTITIISNILILSALKYLDVMLIVGFRMGLLPQLQTGWLAPIGISFYTLQLISYLCDVYWGMSCAQRNPLKLALFTLYFPAISSGPISRYKQLEEPLFASRKFNYKHFTFGLQRILYGLFKKVVIADKIAALTSPVFDDTTEYSGLYIWAAIIVGVIQVYADFSGSMDIVLGISECFGIFLTENFKNPLFSRTIQEMWQKWHITLGTWLKDYIMFPLLRLKAFGQIGKWIKAKCGKRAAKILPTMIAMFFLWLANGIWHGPYPQYMATAMWFWVTVTLGQVFEPFFEKVTRFLKINTECVLWRIFQSTRTIMIFAFGIFLFASTGISSDVIPTLLDALAVKAPDIPTILELCGSKLHFAIFLFGICLLAAVEVYQVRIGSVREWLAKQHIVFRWSILYALIGLIVVMLVDAPPTEFIYFQF